MPAAASTLGTPAFLRGVSGATGAAGATYVTSPMLEPAQYPASAQGVFAEYRQHFPGLAPSAYVLYGYEAMKDVLRMLAKAPPGADRPHRLKAFFGLGVIHGVIGDYTINANGDTSLDSFDGYRVNGAGQLVLARRIS